MTSTLREVAQKLPGNWKKGNPQKYDERACLLGHIALANGKQWDTHMISYEHLHGVTDVHLVSHVINEQYPEWMVTDAVTTVWRFNDSHDEEEVLRIVEKAAARGEEAFDC